MTDQRPPTPEQRIEEMGQAALTIPAPSGGLHELLPEGGEVQSVSSGWRLAVREYLSNKLAVVALVFLVVVVLFCFVGPHIYHTDQVSSNLLLNNQAPSSAPSHRYG